MHVYNVTYFSFKNFRTLKFSDFLVLKGDLKRRDLWFFAHNSSKTLLLFLRHALVAGFIALQLGSDGSGCQMSGSGRVRVLNFFSGSGRVGF